MIGRTNPDFDLSISRIIKAPRQLVWNAWSEPAIFERWWVPAPYKCRVVAMDLRPGGDFATRMSENGRPFTSHVSGCFLDVAPRERIVFTNVLTGGWRPATSFYPAPLTAVITLTDHPDGTEYVCDVMHGNRADCQRHDELGFFEGWNTVVGQLAAVVEARALHRAEPPSTL